MKVFTKPDTTMSLRNLVQRLRGGYAVVSRLTAVEREALENVPNVLTYQKVTESERAGYLVRQWVAYNLYDRMRYGALL